VAYNQENEEAKEPSSVIKWMPDGTIEIVRP